MRWKRFFTVLAQAAACLVVGLLAVYGALQAAIKVFGQGI
jgi:hypothetical protein